MMINSCGYSTNDLVFIYFQICDQDLSRCLASTKDSKSVLELTRDDSKAHASRSHLVVRWSQAQRIVFGSSHLGEEDLQEDLYLGLFSLKFRSCIRID